MKKPQIAAKPQEEARLDPSTLLYNRALKELGITNPVYYCRIVGNRLEFHLVGGDVVVWQGGRK